MDCKYTLEGLGNKVIRVLDEQEAHDMIYKAQSNLPKAQTDSYMSTEYGALARGVASVTVVLSMAPYQFIRIHREQ